MTVQDLNFTSTPVEQIKSIDFNSDEVHKDNVEREEEIQNKIEDSTEEINKAADSFSKENEKRVEDSIEDAENFKAEPTALDESLFTEAFANDTLAGTICDYAEDSIDTLIKTLIYKIDDKFKEYDTDWMSEDAKDFNDLKKATSNLADVFTYFVMKNA